MPTCSLACTHSWCVGGQLVEVLLTYHGSLGDWTQSDLTAEPLSTDTSPWPQAFFFFKKRFCFLRQDLFLKLISWFCMCVWVPCPHSWVCTSCMQCPWRPERNWSGSVCCLVDAGNQIWHPVFTLPSHFSGLPGLEAVLMWLWLTPPPSVTEEDPEFLLLQPLSVKYWD